VGLFWWPGDNTYREPSDLTGLVNNNLYAFAGRQPDTTAATNCTVGTKCSNIWGYMIGDEADMSSNPSHIYPSTVQANAAAFRAIDPDRVIYSNFGKGFALVPWIGYSYGDKTNDMIAYCDAVDIASCDFYGNTDPYEPAVNLGIRAYGRTIDKMRYLCGYKKPIWNFIEVSQPWSNSANKPTPDEVYSAVWISIIHGASGIEYFLHDFWAGDGVTTSDGLTEDAAMTSKVNETNILITSLAQVLNSPHVSWSDYTFSISGNSSQVDIMLKEVNNTLYILTIEGEGNATSVTVSFKSTRIPSDVEVLNEGRKIKLDSSTYETYTFSDTYSGYQVHLYKVTTDGGSTSAASANSSTVTTLLLALLAACIFQVML